MSENTHPEDYAYPVAPGDVAYWQPGMTLRDYLAAQIVTGAGPQSHPHALARWAYQLADAMLAERGQ